MSGMEQLIAQRYDNDFNKMFIRMGLDKLHHNVNYKFRLTGEVK